MASGHVNRIKRPNTWLHRPMLQNVKKALANSEPSTHGTERTWLSGGGCPVSGVEQKSQFEAVRSPFDPSRKSSPGFAVTQTSALYHDVVSVALGLEWLHEATGLH
jgi:hypothetical protein